MLNAKTLKGFLKANIKAIKGFVFLLAEEIPLIACVCAALYQLKKTAQIEC
jgi:hypothetical protein